MAGGAYDRSQRLPTQWRRPSALGARSAAEARGCIVATLRRRLGLFVSRELARLRLRRIPLIGVPASELRPLARTAREQWRRRHGAEGEPAAATPAFVPEDYYAYQSHAAAR